MARINRRAWEILQAELQKCAGNDLALQVQREIVLKRLQRMRSQDGPLVSYEQMRETVIDFFPNFSDKALKSAAKANRPPGVWSKQNKMGYYFVGNSAYSSGDSSQKISILQGIIYQLQEVKPGTTAYSEAQQLLQFAQKRLNQVQSSAPVPLKNN